MTVSLITGSSGTFFLLFLLSSGRVSATLLVSLPVCALASLVAVGDLPTAGTDVNALYNRTTVLTSTELVACGLAPIRLTCILDGRSSEVSLRIFVSWQGD